MSSSSSCSSSKIHFHLAGFTLINKPGLQRAGTLNEAVKTRDRTMRHQIHPSQLTLYQSVIITSCARGDTKCPRPSPPP